MTSSIWCTLSRKPLVLSGLTLSLWAKLNDLASERPILWINEICWHEMNVDDELNATRR